MNSPLRGVWFAFGAAVATVSVIALSSCTTCKCRDASSGLSQRRTLLDAEWLFHRGEVEDSNAVVKMDFNDRQWQAVHLPHDYILDETVYDPTNVRNHGYLSVTNAWYRKHFTVPASDEGKVLRLDFDGVFRDSEVWFNGTYLGRHQSGYTPFSYDITSLAKPGAENVITVRVDPRDFEGWWYEGGGIYRHVYLTALAPVHVAQWGTYVVSSVPNGEQGADGEADITIRTTVENGGQDGAEFQVISTIMGPHGQVGESLSENGDVPGKGSREIVQHTALLQPRLWSLESPNLYQLRTTILQNGKSVDMTTTTFGVRTIHYDAQKGFFLNGKHVELQGLCNHQDLSAFGIAVPDNLQAWRVAQLKKAGFNAWRTAHNPPSEALLDACDRMGVMVMDENRHLGDSYNHHSPKGTTATNLSDLATMIRRDRNHPSIIMWSMCNEEGLQGSKEGAAIFSAMMKVVHQYDLTRPVTSAMNGGFFYDGDADAEDIVGVNYNVEKYDKIHQRRPDKPMFGSEDTNEKTTRGEYADDKSTGMCSAYNLSEKNWRAVVERPFMCGSFTWTGFDYRGEPNPFGWPDISNNTGLLDLCGNPKDKFYYFQSCWSEKPMVHLLPDSWNWAGKKGKEIRVIAFSNAKKVELSLNGRSLGSKDVAPNSYAEWQVPYEPGHLVAMAISGNETVAMEDLSTTEMPARIELQPVRHTLTANGEDAMMIPISILDKNGKVVPDADNEVSVELKGNGHLVGLGNGNPADHTPDRATRKKVFHGRCVVIVQAGEMPGVMEVTVNSAELKSARTSIRVR